MTEGRPLRLRRRRLSHLPLQGRQTPPASPQIVFCCEKTLDSKQGRGYTKYTKSGRLARRFLVPPVQKRAKKVNMARMNDPREAAPCGAEGEGKNSQAKGSDQDGTSESARQRRCTPKGQPVQDRESLRFGRFFHKALPFFFEEELCQARQRPQGIPCVFPRAITQHGAIVPGKEGMVLWKKRLRRRQKDQRGLSASLFAQKQRVVLPPAGEAPAKRVMREKLSPRLAIVRASPSSVTALAGDRAAPASPAGGSTETLPRHSSKLKSQNSKR